MDTLTKRQRSERMAQIRSRDTGPERQVQEILFRLRHRNFFTHDGTLPGNPDFVFPRLKKIVFVHGCFWHRHQSLKCKLARLPKTKVGFWLHKLEANRIRDLRTQQRLRRDGWSVCTIWECNLANTRRVQSKLCKFLQG